MPRYREHVQRKSIPSRNLNLDIGYQRMCCRPRLPLLRLKQDELTTAILITITRRLHPTLGTCYLFVNDALGVSSQALWQTANIKAALK